MLPEGSYELGFVRPSDPPFVLLPRNFLGIDSVVFLEISMVLGAHVGGFLKKIFLPPK